jgi:hypothetical protein
MAITQPPNYSCEYSQQKSRLSTLLHPTQVFWRSFCQTKIPWLRPDLESFQNDDDDADADAEIMFALEESPCDLYSNALPAGIGSGDDSSGSSSENSTGGKESESGGKSEKNNKNKNKNKRMDPKKRKPAPPLEYRSDE